MIRTLIRVVPVVAAPLVLNACVVASTSSSGNGAAGLVLLLPLVFFFAMVLLARPRRQRRALRREVGDPGPRISEPMLRAELSVLADDVLRLEPRVAMCEAARDDYEAATHRYRVALAALERGTEGDVDLVRVQRVIDEAGWAMARARAAIDGRALPEPPASLQRPGGGGEPAVGLDGEQPVYVDSPATFSTGWFGFGGLLGPMLGGWVVRNDAWDDGWDDGRDDGRGRRR